MSWGSFAICQRTWFQAQLRSEGRISDMKNGLSLTRTKQSTLKYASSITHTSQLLREPRGLSKFGLLIVQFSLKADEWSRQPLILPSDWQLGGLFGLLPEHLSWNYKSWAGIDWKALRCTVDGVEHRESKKDSNVSYISKVRLSHLIGLAVCPFHLAVEPEMESWSLAYKHSRLHSWRT